MFKRLKALLFGSLRRQLTLSVALTNTLMMSLFIWTATERQQSLLLERQSDYATALAQSVATSSAGWLEARDFYGLQEIVRAQSRYPELLYAMVIDSRGRVVAHSDTTRLNQYVLDLPKIDPGAPTPSYPYILNHDEALTDVACPVILGEHQIGWVRVGLGQQALNARLTIIARDGLIYAIGAVLITSALAGILGWRLTRRLYAIRQVTDAIQAGDHGQRARLSGVDEAAGLAHAFDDMLDTLESRDQALRLATERLQMATRAGIIGIWDWDIVKSELIWDDMMYQLYGIRRGQFAGTYEGWLSFLHPEDRIQAEQNIQAALRGDREYGLEFRVIWPDKSIHHIKAASQTLRDKTGQPLRMIGINYDLTDRKLAEAELEQHRHHLEQLVKDRTEQMVVARDAAEAANRAKSVFLANMSHELRTPLNAILGFAQLMERDERLPSDVHHNLQTINRAGRHLLALINDVLDISRIEAGHTTTQNAVFDLHDTLTGIEEMIRLRAEHKGLGFSVEHSGELPRFVYGDANHLRQVLINLLGNAVKYTELGTTSLRLTPGSDSSIRFEVIDSGPGIAAEDQEQIFQPFYQSASGIAKGEGTGLGLSISREYVRLMGGSLQVESKPDKGSIFRFSLPLPEAEVPVVQIHQRRVLGLAPGHPPVRILVVEDNPDNQELISSLLVNAGFEVRMAENGQRGIDIFQDWQPHFIWMDMRMPVLDGYQTTQAIRKLPGGDMVKIVALTASAFHENRDAILAAGCDEMLAKPIDETRMYLLMGELLGLSYHYADESIVDLPTTRDADAHLQTTNLPEPLRSELSAAAELLDTDAVRNIVDGMMTDHPELAGLIGEWISDYRFDKILDLCRQPKEDIR